MLIVHRILLHHLRVVDDLLVVVFDKLTHAFHRAKLLLANGDFIKPTIGKGLLHGLQIRPGCFGTLLGGLDLPFHLWFGIMDICLVGFPLLLTALILAHFLLCVVLQQSILTTGELRHRITKHVLFLFQHTVVHAVIHQLVTFHDAVSNGTLGL